LRGCSAIDISAGRDSERRVEAAVHSRELLTKDAVEIGGTLESQSRLAARLIGCLAALCSSQTAFRGRWQWRSRGLWAGTFPLNNRELERQVPGISVRRPRVMCDLRVAIAFLAHHVSKDLFKATEGLAFKRPAQAKVSTM
jgi:hypothetical protein